MFIITLLLEIFGILIDIYNLYDLTEAHELNED
jgi:hypothetical protein